MIIPKVAKQAVAALAIAVGLMALASSARAEAWLYNGDRQGDYFENLGNGNWREVVGANTVWNFREKMRTNTIILEDVSRDVRIQMTGNAVYIEAPGSNGYHFFHYGSYRP